MENELENIRSKIYTIRGVKVMLDFDLAVLYGVETRAINQAVKRNMKRFPTDFMFKLENAELENLKSQIVISSWGGRRWRPIAFTEQGLAMLSGLLKSDIAIQVNIQIMRAFVQMRNYLATTANLTAELEELKKKLTSLERSDSNNQLAINKISKDIDNIYLAIAALSITAPPVQKPKPVNRIGFKQNSTKK
ncbi:MAG TPA: ORF6N domain-containing protein [Candidatus Egerieousia sp.]|nr:ORF6N domain-containing protein [Candidatus Egerieousia sp.]